MAGCHFMAEPDMPSPYIRISYSLATPVMLDQVRKSSKHFNVLNFRGEFQKDGEVTILKGLMS